MTAFEQSAQSQQVVTRRRRRAPVLLTGLLALVALGTSGLAATGTSGPDTTPLQNLLTAAAQPGLQSLPADGGPALTDAIEAVSADLGVVPNAQALLATATLPQTVSSRLAVVLQDIHACNAVSRQAMATVPTDPWVTQGGDSLPQIPSALVTAMQDCAGVLYSDGLALNQFLLSVKASGASAQLSLVDVWPVLRFDPTTTSEANTWDYTLMVDFGGNDTYLNNAGGNLIDVKRSPQNSTRARGCEKVGDFLLNPDPQCVPASALLIDLAGNDTYEALESPEGSPDGSIGDTDCTHDPLVRRIATEGSGIVGVGILINDSTGNTHYLGKTASQGTGHVGGVGVLDIGGGNNSYLAIRNAQGFGFVSGLGLLRERAGNQTHATYMPQPFLEPDGTWSAGGVVSDTGVCDSTPRHVQGAGEAGGLGALTSTGGGNDTYSSDTPAAQGFGELPLVGAGDFLDVGGNDTYTGVPGRANDTSVHSGNGEFDDCATATSCTQQQQVITLLGQS